MANKLRQRFGILISPLIRSRFATGLFPPPAFLEQNDIISKGSTYGIVSGERPEITISPGYFNPNFNAIFDQYGNLIGCSALTRRRVDERHNSPEKITLEKNGSTLTAAVYGGVLFGKHYGHFLTETMSRLWPFAIPELSHQWNNYPIIFRMAKTAKAGIAPFAECMLRALGVWDRVLIPERELFVKQCIIPHPAIYNNRQIHREYATLMRSVGEVVVRQRVPKTNWEQKRLYLSRSGLPSYNRKLANEKQLESRLVRHGYMVVHPEEMPFDEQVGMFRDASEIVGPIGSAFHTTMLAGNANQKLKYLVHYTPQCATTYNNIDAVLGNDAMCIQCVYKHPLNLKGPSCEDQIIHIARAVDGILSDSRE